MATGRRPDPRRRRTAHPHSTYLCVKPGTTESGYKAGELFGCYGHRTSAQQPCLSDLTNDALECPYCKAGMIPDWRGYVPIWDRDWTLRHVLIGEDFFESVDSIPTHTQVTVSRAKNPISPLIVREQLTLVKKLPDREPWSQPVNMLAICLTLWKSDVLIGWFNRNPSELAKAMPIATPKPVKEAKPAKKPMQRYFAAEQKAIEESAVAEQHIGNVMDKLLKPAANAMGPFKAPRKG